MADGFIPTSAKETLSNRLHTIYNELKKIIEFYKPDEASIEITFLNTNPETSLKLSMARGVVFLMPAIYNIPLFEYEPNKIKKALTGVGKADKNQVETICTEYKYNKSFKVIINAKNGEEIAKKTFNERLGIIGGISILGTTGIVEPMSEKELVESIKKEIDVYLAGNDYILITPGNYGKEAAYNHFGIDLEKGVKISNFIGEILDYLLYKNPKGILLIGHAGKLSKVAGGIMNTHSSYADCRHEIFASYAALYGARQKVIEEIFNAATTDEMDYILIKNNLHEKVWQKIMDNVVENINRINNKHLIKRISNHLETSSLPSSSLIVFQLLKTLT